MKITRNIKKEKILRKGRHCAHPQWGWWNYVILRRKTLFYKESDQIYDY
jgi:hypothetical protein